MTRYPPLPGVISVQALKFRSTNFQSCPANQREAFIENSKQADEVAAKAYAEEQNILKAFYEKHIASKD